MAKRLSGRKSINRPIRFVNVNKKGERIKINNLDKMLDSLMRCINHWLVKEANVVPKPVLLYVC